VKEYFQDPRVMYTAMEEEAEALTHGINEIWDSIVDFQKSEFASREISGAWK
jgi:hypothetical protein